ncbi:Alpha/Beta hydrolase protein [Scleroderma yunnanense]
MTTITVTEGEADFIVPAAGKPCKTWYKVYGDLKSGVCPLVVLHGGPGATHEYVGTISQLAYTHGIPVVFYDQIGNGLSTHLPEKMGDVGFWTVQLFIDELDNILNHLGIHDNYALLGQSWGGMLAAEYAVQQPVGLKKLVIADSPASMDLWMEATNRLKLQLPQDVQDTLAKHEKEGTTSDEAYQEAMGVFYEHFMCRIKPMPEAFTASFKWIKDDPTVYFTMVGPSDFYVVGSLKTWNIIDRLHTINVTTLLINGRYDEAQDSTVAPYFQYIPKVKWVQFAESAHCPQLEEIERFMEVVGGFLLGNY